MPGSTAKRLVVFVEGDADIGGISVLCKRTMTELNAWAHLRLDPAVMKTKGLSNLTGRHAHNWPRLIQAALKRGNVGAILLVVDGDFDHMFDESGSKVPFCAAAVARTLARRAREAGAGSTFSLACVVARQEAESWFIAGFESLAQQLGGTAGDLPPDPDEAPRDAKRWLRKRLADGYRATVDQERLAKLIDRSLCDQRSRSFRRFTHAIAELCDAVRSGSHSASPE